MTTLADWLAVEPPALRATVQAMAAACREVASAVAAASLAGRHGDAATTNPHGETQKELDLVADHAVAAALRDCASVAAWVSEEREAPVVVAAQAGSGEHLVAVDPLDGSGSASSNLAVGTIFSVLPHPFRGTPAGDAGFLQPGRKQCAAGYAIYGPATLLVLACSGEPALFALEPRDGTWALMRDGLKLPRGTREFAINVSNQRFWEAPVQRYVAECIAGAEGPRAADFNMRWLGCMATEVHRVLLRGGVYLYPRDGREPRRPGRLRLLYEAAPMALIVERAGGAAVTGTQPLLDIVPDTVHQTVPVILGDRAEVERIVGYHADTEQSAHRPLFRERSLFAPPGR